jgi:HJR/Mrr/RecB family endonuclease
MKLKVLVMTALCSMLLMNSVAAAENKTGLATITREYHKLSVLLQQCSIMFPKFSTSYKQHFSKWLIRNRLALKKGERESKQLSAKNGMRFEKSVLAYQLSLKKKYSDPEQMTKDKICAYLPSIMAE